MSMYSNLCLSFSSFLLSSKKKICWNLFTLRPLFIRILITLICIFWVSRSFWAETLYWVKTLSHLPIIMNEAADTHFKQKSFVFSCLSKWVDEIQVWANMHANLMFITCIKTRRWNNNNKNYIKLPNCDHLLDIFIN